jgi:DNA-binding XRE family transcriptional regulator
MVGMQWIAVDALKPNARNARTHSNKQIRQIANSISAFGFLVPILIDEDGVIIAGHGRHAAAKLLGLKQVPIIGVEGLSESKRRALALAENKVAEAAGWDREHVSGMITPEQSRAARGLLAWSQQDLAKKAGVGVVTVHQLEAGTSQPRRATLDVIRRAFESAGVEFIDDGRGVRLRKRYRPKTPRP